MNRPALRAKVIIAAIACILALTACDPQVRRSEFRPAIEHVELLQHHIIHMLEGMRP